MERTLHTLSLTALLTASPFVCHGRALGSFPGVSISKTTSVRASSLFADVYCGDETKLIYYISEGTILSRTFTSKDTHSPRGDLIVLYSDRQSTARDVEVARATMGILGFTPPSFTSGTDLILPVEINADLRKRLISEFSIAGTPEEEDEVLASIISQHDDISVPQVRRFKWLRHEITIDPLLAIHHMRVQSFSSHVNCVLHGRLE